MTTGYRINVPDLSLDGQLYGQCPVQGEGRIAGYYFYFRARGAHWTCAAYFDLANPEPSHFAGLEPDAHDQLFEVDGVSGYVHCGDYGSNFDAGYMPYEDAEYFVRIFARDFLTKLQERSALQHEHRRRLLALERLAEESISAMYDAIHPTNATGHYSNAKEALHDAIGLARQIGDGPTAERLSRRLADIKATFRSQF